jgi:phage terminase small subunit
MKSKNRQTLTPKQARFAQEYLIDLNGTQAAIRAGYSARTAAEQASRLLGKVNIQQAIQKAQEKRSERTKITQDWVIGNLRAIVERCLGAVPVMTKINGEWVESGEWKFDSSGANRALELIGKHLGAFVDKAVIEHKSGIDGMSGEELRAYCRDLMSRATPEQLASLGLGPALPDG